MGTLLLSRWSWSVHLVRGRLGGRFHVGSAGRPTDSSTWCSMAWGAGMLSGNLATCPNMALRPLVIRSDTGARPVRKETSLRVLRRRQEVSGLVRIHSHSWSVRVTDSRSCDAGTAAAKRPARESGFAGRPLTLVRHVFAE